MPILLDLYLTFFVLGGTTFGGGYAMLPVLQRVVAQKKGWATEAELADYFAIGQCTPGIIAVNVATFVGTRYKGVLGGIVATLGLVSPCVLIITAIGSLFSGAASNAFFNHGFNGVKACVAVLVGGSAWKILQEAVVDKTTGRIFYGVFSMMVLGHLYPELHPLLETISSPIFLVIASAATGYFLMAKEETKS